MEDSEFAFFSIVQFKSPQIAVSSSCLFGDEAILVFSLIEASFIHWKVIWVMSL